MRRLSVITFIAVCVIFFTDSASPVAADEQERPQWSGSGSVVLFKGKLAGVSFERIKDGDETAQLVKLHFEECTTFAGIGVFYASEFGSYSVMTDWPADPQSINESNYVTAIEAMFKAPIRLGQECLVKTDVVEGLRRTLQSVERASEDATAALLQEHRELILQSRRRWTVASFYARQVRIGTLRHTILNEEQVLADLRHTGHESEADAREQFAAKYREDYELECATLYELIDARIAELRVEISESDDQLELQYLKWTILDLDDVRIDVQEKRDL